MLSPLTNHPSLPGGKGGGQPGVAGPHGVGGGGLSPRVRSGVVQPGLSLLPASHQDHLRAYNVCEGIQIMPLQLLVTLPFSSLAQEAAPP